MYEKKKKNKYKTEYKIAMNIKTSSRYFTKYLRKRKKKHQKKKSISFRAKFSEFLKIRWKQTVVNGLLSRFLLLCFNFTFNLLFIVYTNQMFP